MKITRKKLRNLILQEAMIKAGQMRFNLDIDKLLSSGYTGGRLPNSPNPTAEEMSTLRGAMILRALIQTTSDIPAGRGRASSSLVASIGEEIASALLGGTLINSSWLGGDDAIFADVKTGNTFWSIKMRAASRTAGLPETPIKSLQKAVNYYGEDKKYSSLILVLEESGIRILKWPGDYFKKEDFKIGENGRDVSVKDKPIGSAAGGNVKLTSKSNMNKVFGIPEEFTCKIASEDEIIKSLMSFDPGGPMLGPSGPSSWETMDFDNQAIDTYENFRLNEIEDVRRLQTTVTGPGRFDMSYRGTAKSWQQFKEIISSPNISASEIVKLFPFFGEGLGAASQRSDRFISSASKFISGDTSGRRRNFVYKSSKLFELMSQVMDSYSGNDITDDELNTIISKIDALVKDLSGLSSNS